MVVNLTQVIFCRPRHTYDSYSDYQRLIELSGYPLQFIDEIDPDSNNCYIFSTPATHWHDGVERRGWPGARARIIYYSLEWYPDVDYANVPGVEVWSPDRWWADRIGARYVPFGSHPDLVHEALPAEREIHYDVAMLSYMNYRRGHVYGQLLEAGVTFAPGGWGKERHDALAQSKIMLHVHQQDDIATIAPQRFALAAAYKLPLISETIVDWGILQSLHLPQSVFEHLPRFTRNWLRDETRELDNFAWALHHLLCEQYTFRNCIEAAV